MTDFSRSIAISATALCTGDGETLPLSPRVPGSMEWPALADAFATLAAKRKQQNGATVIVSLLPPLVQLRALLLPKMRHDDAVAVIGRGVTRYFPAVREPQTVAVARIDAAGTDPTHATYAVIAAPAALLTAVERAAATVGWTVTRFVPAYSAWIAATRTNGAAVRSVGGPSIGGPSASGHSSGTSPRHPRRTETVALIERDDGGDDVILATNGTPREVRRFRADADVTHDAVSRDAVRIETPATAAARFGPKTSALELMTPAISDQRRARRRTTIVAAAAAVLVVCTVAGVATFVHANHELRDIAAERAALRPSVERAARTQTALLAVSQPAQSLARVEEHGPRWAPILNDLADYLPPDAFIESLRATGDSLTIDGAANTGARVFQTVAASPSLTHVAPIGPIRRDAPASTDAANTGDRPLERFTLFARIAKAVPLAPAPARRRSLSRR